MSNQHEIEIGTIVKVDGEDGLWLIYSHATFGVRGRNATYKYEVVNWRGDVETVALDAVYAVKIATDYDVWTDTPYELSSSPGIMHYIAGAGVPRTATEVAHLLPTTLDGYVISVTEERGKLVLCATPILGEKQSGDWTGWTDGNWKRVVVGAAITSDNYEAGEPDQLELIDVLVRWFGNWRDSETISEIRHIFGCGALEASDKTARLQTINHEALQLQYASKSVTSDVTIDLHVTGAEGLYIKRAQITVKIPLNAVDSELLSAVDALFPGAKWYGEDGGYAHAW